jgi:cytochrome b6-f complex iron-sulfur subunit
MSCDDCLSRRAFLAKGTLAVAGAAALAAGCGDGQFGVEAVSGVIPTGGISFKVSTVPALATVGQLVKIAPATAYIAVKRTGTNTFAAISTVCTHQGCEINIAGPAFECPCHGSGYDNDGKVIRQPVGGGSATNLPTYTTQYNAATDILTIG